LAWPLSAATIRISNETIIAELAFARADIELLVPGLDANYDGRITQSDIDANKTRLQQLARNALEISAEKTVVPSKNISFTLDPSDGLHLKLTFPRQHATALDIRSLTFSRLPRGHRQYFSASDTSKSFHYDRMLDAEHNTASITLACTTASKSDSDTFGRFLLLGIEHIATGYDHLVFLFGLLIVGAGWRPVLKIISAFTVAHSLTLALATLELIRIPSRIVEPLIAASIIYVGVENICRRGGDHRWMVAFSFGLIHGCGFASALRELGIGSSGSPVLWPLISFNLGVETGQLVVAATLLPIIWKFRDGLMFQRGWLPTISILIALAGGVWLIERLIA
jgi:hydrogenase/urease accessory protein HupE